MDDNKRISHEFLLEHGFENPSRYWCKHQEQFRLCYKIEGYDCDVLVSPMPQVVPNEYNEFGDGVHFMPPEVQVDEFSSISTLQGHHTGDFQVFINSFENHCATFEYEQQLLIFMAVCGKPIKPINPNQ